MNKKIFYFIPMLMLSTVLLAQNSMSEINRIKRDSGYLYGEATLDQKDAAVKLAYEMLEVEIKNWAANKDPKISSVLASQVFNYADTIILHRRNMVRAFAYVKISNLKVVKGKTIAIEVNRDEPLTKPIASNEEVSKPLATAVNTQELKTEEKPQKPSAAEATTTTPPAPVQKAVLPKANHSGGNEAEVLAKLKAVADANNWDTALNFAISIYLDIINLFISLMNLMSSNN